jgi:hypothetical protein
MTHVLFEPVEKIINNMGIVVAIFDDFNAIFKRYFVD